MSDPCSVQPPTQGRFSVIVPSLQQARFLERTLQSILAQDHADAEIIVENGGSTDGSIEILKRYEGRLRWESRPGNGQTAAINAGLRKALRLVQTLSQSRDHPVLPAASETEYLKGFTLEVS